MMRSSQLHIAALIVAVILALGFVLGRCSDKSRPQLIATVKKIPVEVRIPSVVIDKRIDTVYVTHDKTDTAAIRRLIAVRDSLRIELNRRGVGVAFGMDTITAYRDTISVWCDEIRRQIKASIRFGLRDTTILHEDTNIIFPMQQSKWSLSVGFGASLSLESSVAIVRPAVFVGVSYSIFNF
jgi:hypothetical protein